MALPRIYSAILQPEPALWNPTDELPQHAQVTELQLTAGLLQLCKVVVHSRQPAKTTPIERARMWRIWRLGVLILAIPPKLTLMTVG